MSLKEQLIREKLPGHVAIIMDGNGRWAKRKGAARIFGHQHGVTPVDEVVKASAELGIKYLTLYAFSTENWSRPAEEIDALMGLLVATIRKETKKLVDNNIRLQTVGDVTELPDNTRKELDQLISATAANTGLTVILALSYSSRYEIILAARRIIRDAAEGKLSADEMNCAKFEEYLQTAGYPDPDLLIRTSGEYRLSNFLLYQLAYTELYFTSKLWPDFSAEDYYEALLDYQNRERRFGKTSEQL
jgi:undecaprenyl diphosphate synthase